MVKGRKYRREELYFLVWAPVTGLVVGSSPPKWAPTVVKFLKLPFELSLFMSKQFYEYSNSDISPISHEAKFRIKIFISSVPITALVCLFAF